MTEKKHVNVWDDCLQIIRDNIDKQKFSTWFKPILPESFNGKVLTLQVPSYFFYEYLEEHYISLLHHALRRVIGQKFQLKYKVKITGSNSEAVNTKNHFTTVTSTGVKDTNSRTKSAANGFDKISNPFIISGIRKPNIDPQLNKNYTFKSFIEGSCNRLARSAGLSIARDINQTTFNPLFIYSNSGLGKTHLVQAIGHETLKNFPKKLVLYVTANRFQTQYTEAVRKNNINDFIHFYQMIELLIIDDVHEFAGKEKTQEVFFHFFNHLHQAGRQLILTADKPPSALKGMNERIISRFKWGLTVNLYPPGVKTRLKILKNRLLKENIKLDKEVLHYIANSVKKNIRELEGVLISIIAHASLNNRKIDLNLAKQVVDKITLKHNKEITVNFIKNIVCDYYNMSRTCLEERSRRREIVQARQVAMYFSKKFTKNSLSSIGRQIGNKDHSTVLYADKTVRNLIDTNKYFKAQIKEIKEIINSQ